MVNYDYNNLSATELEQITKNVNSKFAELEILESETDTIVIECVDQISFLGSKILRKYKLEPDKNDKLKMFSSIGEGLVNDCKLLINRNNERKERMINELDAVMHFHEQKKYDTNMLKVLDINKRQIISITTEFRSSFESLITIKKRINNLYFDVMVAGKFHEVIDQCLDIMKPITPFLINNLNESKSETDRIHSKIDYTKKVCDNLRDKAIKMSNTDYYVNNKNSDHMQLDKLPERVMGIDKLIAESDHLLSKTSSLSVYVQTVMNKGKVLKETEPIIDKFINKQPINYRDLITLIEHVTKIIRLREKVLDLEEAKEELTKAYDDIIELAKDIDRSITLLSKQETDYRHIYK